MAFSTGTIAFRLINSAYRRSQVSLNPPSSFSFATVKSSLVLVWYAACWIWQTVVCALNVLLWCWGISEQPSRFTHVCSWLAFISSTGRTASGDPCTLFPLSFDGWYGLMPFRQFRYLGISLTRYFNTGPDPDVHFQLWIQFILSSFEKSSVYCFHMWIPDQGFVFI